MQETALGSMSPLITVLLAVAFQKKRFSVKTWLSLPVICLGLAICSVKAWESVAKRRVGSRSYNELSATATRDLFLQRERVEEVEETGLSLMKEIPWNPFLWAKALCCNVRN